MPYKSSSSLRQRKARATSQGKHTASGHQSKGFQETEDMASISEDPDHSKAKEPFSNTNTDLNGPSDLNEDDEQFGVIHQLPLIFVLLPTLGSAVFGRAEVWTDILLLSIVGVYLYQLVRVPWDLYYSSRRRRKSAAHMLSSSKRKKDGPKDSELQEKEAAVAELRRMELVCLAMTVAAPWLGSTLLHWIKPVLSEPDRYINPYSVRLFTLAAGIKPVFHLWRRLQQRSAELQSIISQPSSDEWTSVVERLTSLETAFNQLVGTAALKTDVRQLKTALDTPLTDLVKAVARHERKNDLLRLSAQSRFEELAEQLSDLDAECEAHEAILDDLSGQLEEARQKYSDEHRRTQWIKIILFGSAAGGSSDSQQAPGVRQILGSALHILFLPLTAPFQASTLLLRYAGRRLFLPAPPHCSPTSQPPALSSTSNSIATTPHPSPKDVPLKSNLKKTS